MNYFSKNGLNLLLFIGYIGGGGACGAIFAVGSSPIFFLMGALTLMTQSMILAAFWQAFWGCVYFGMGIGFLTGLVILISKR